MKFFGQLVRTAVNVVALPVEITRDIVMAPLDVMGATDKNIGSRTLAQVKKLKDEADE